MRMRNIVRALEGGLHYECATSCLVFERDMHANARHLQGEEEPRANVRHRVWSLNVICMQMREIVKARKNRVRMRDIVFGL